LRRKGGRGGGGLEGEGKVGPSLAGTEEFRVGGVRSKKGENGRGKGQGRHETKGWGGENRSKGERQTMKNGSVPGKEGIPQGR